MTLSTVSPTTGRAAPAGAPSAPAIPHACHPDSVPRQDPSGRTARRAKSRRLIGVDAARGVAMLAMVVVHILPPTSPQGDMSLPWLFSVWNAAALFALVSGISLALSTGRTSPPRGRAWASAGVGLAVRAVLIGAIGLLLGEVVPIARAVVILPYFAVLFLLAIPLLRLRVRWLVPLTLVVGVGVPLLSQAWRADLPAASLTNPTFSDLVTAPGELGIELLLTGVYPALPYLVYVCAGLAIGRARLDLRKTVSTMTIAGLALAAAASATAWYLMERAGGSEALQAVALESMPLVDYLDQRVWGFNGSVPTTSDWWLAVLAPNSGTPVDLLFTTGLAVAIVGASIFLSRVAAPLLFPLALIGSMTLTLYVGHLLLLSAPFIAARGSDEFWLHLALLVGFAALWRLWFTRGPLEQILSVATERTRRLTAPVFRAPPAVAEAAGSPDRASAR